MVDGDTAIELSLCDGRGHAREPGTDETNTALGGRRRSRPPSDTSCNGRPLENSMRVPQPSVMQVTALSVPAQKCSCEQGTIHFTPVLIALPYCNNLSATRWEQWSQPSSGV